MQSSSSSLNINALTQDEQSFLSFLSFLDVLSNCLNLAFAQTVAAPFERIKLVMQSQFALQQTGVIRGLPFETVRSTTKRLWEIEGIDSFWRGNSINVLRAFPTSLIVWLKVGELPTASIFGRYKKQRDGFVLWFLSSWLQATASSALFLALLYPLEFCRVGLAADVVTAPNSIYLKVGMRSFPPQNGGTGSSWTCYRDLIHHVVSNKSIPGGFGLYAGFGFSVASLAIYRAFHILIQEKINFLSATRPSSSSSSSISGKDNTSSSLSSPRPSTFFGDLFRSWVICTSAGFVAYPLDTVSKWSIVETALGSNHQKSTAAMNNHEYNFSPRTGKVLATEAFRIGGIRQFYHGALVNVVRNGVVMGCLHCGIWNYVLQAL